METRRVVLWSLLTVYGLDVLYLLWGGYKYFLYGEEIDPTTMYFVTIFSLGTNMVYSFFQFRWIGEK